MSLSCLNNWVGIRGCGITAPPSGVYINSMAGISVAMMEKLSKEEANTFVLIWNDIQDRAIRRMQLAVQSQFGRRSKISNIQNSYDMGVDVDTTQVTAAAAEYRGIFVDTQYFLISPDWKRSALQEIWIQNLSFYSTNVNAFNFLIFDTETGNLIATIPVATVVVGWNTVAVNTVYLSAKIFIAIDCTARTTIYKYAPNSLMAFGSNVRGAKITIGGSFFNLEYGQNTFGIGGQFGIRCKYDAIVCNNLDVFTTAFSYLLASEWCMERLSSDRINKYTADRKQAEELKAHYDLEFEKAIVQSCDYIDLDQSDMCIECDEEWTVRESNFAPHPRLINYEN